MDKGIYSSVNEYPTMSDEPSRLSRKLCEVLERVGVSESMRKLYRDTSITAEISTDLIVNICGTNASTYNFGSSSEGTTTPGMGSDRDIVLCLEFLPVIQNITEAPPGVSLLMVTDRHTRPGYVKLQVVRDGIQLTRHNYHINDTGSSYDRTGRVCKKHIVGQLKDINERNGPADTISNKPYEVPQDFVAAVRCRTYPQIARDSLEKCISFGWMSREEVESMKGLGILLVGTGHPASEERDIEWRMSFSFQERQLMVSLNPIQHKCYVTLKLLKNIVTEGLPGKQSLTSYHCKTCLFSVITDTGLALWSDENLIKCVFICLTKLIHWVSRGYCPNFFIDQSNMFERREFVRVQERLQACVSQGPSLFYRIKSEDIGEALRGRPSRHIEDRRVKQAHALYIHMCGDIVYLQTSILKYCHKLRSSQLITRYLFQKLCYLTSIDTITEHTQEQTQATARLLVPIMQKLYAQQLASVAFSLETAASRHRLLDVSARHLSRGKKCDRMSDSLMVATILYRGGHVGSCRDLLEQIERSIMHGAVVSCCRCHSHAIVLNKYLQQRISSGKISQQNIMELAVASCMAFLPSQSEIIPKALQYEMYRSVGTSPGTRDKDHDYWFDWAVVDSKIYLFFMQYLVYSDLNQPVAKRIAIDQIWKKLLDHNDVNILLNVSNLGHRETAYNLLGWIYIQEGQISKAIECFRHSWRIRPDHNAAKWHVLELHQQMHRHQ